MQIANNKTRKFYYGWHTEVLYIKKDNILNVCVSIISNGNLRIDVWKQSKQLEIMVIIMGTVLISVMTKPTRTLIRRYALRDTYLAIKYIILFILCQNITIEFEMIFIFYN